MYKPLFNECLASVDTLKVYKDDKLLFSSSKDRLLTLLEYIDKLAPYHQMEKLSINKEPEEFYEVIRSIIK